MKTAFVNERNFISPCNSCFPGWEISSLERYQTPTRFKYESTQIHKRKEETMTEYVAAIVSGVIALIALIYTVKMQMNANIEKWMNLLREALFPIFTQAEILRLTHSENGGKTGSKTRFSSTELGELRGKLCRVELLLDPDDAEQKEIIELSNSLAKNAEDSTSTWESFNSLERSLIDKSQTLLKAHWKKIYKKEWERFLTIILAAFITTILVSAVILVFGNKSIQEYPAPKESDNPPKIEIASNPINSISFSCDSVIGKSKSRKLFKSSDCSSKIDSIAKK